jgi:hypothetical protein
MRTIVLSALFALGVGFAGTTGALATVGSGISGAANSSSLVQDVRYRCRSVKVCRAGYYGYRRCHWERVCRHWY